MVNVCNAALAQYDSEVVSVDPIVPRRGDAVQSLLAACRKHDMRFVAWRVCFRRLGWTTSPAFDLRIDAGRGQRSFAGKPSYKMLCPNDPANPKYEVDVCVELARKGVWAVSLDYIRYESPDYCFCDRCRDLFVQRVSAEKLKDWPKSVREDKALKAEWERFRCETITSLVREIRKAMKEAVPNCKLTASVVRPGWKELAAQEWEAWCREGLMDCVGPMNYYDRGYPRIEDIHKDIDVEKGYAGNVPIKPTLYPICIIWDPCTEFDLGLRTRYLLDSIREYRRLGIKAFSIFEFTNPFIDLIGMGMEK